MKILTTLVVTTSILTLAGCASTIHKTQALGFSGEEVDTLSVDAKQRLVVSTKNGGRHGDRRVTCAEPSPDALVAASAIAATSFNIGNGTTTQKGEALGGIQEAASSLGVRSQTIQILRDGYYRLCEGYMNGVVHEDRYRDVIQNLDTTIAIVMALDSLSSGNKNVPVQIAGGALELSEPSDDGARTLKIEDPKLSLDGKSNQSAADQTRAEEITNVIDSFLNYKKWQLTRARTLK